MDKGYGSLGSEYIVEKGNEYAGIEGNRILREFILQENLFKVDILLVEVSTLVNSKATKDLNIVILGS